MKRILLAAAGLLLVGSLTACCGLPPVPKVDISVDPDIKVGPLQEKEETIPLDGEGPTDVEVLFGAGELEIAAGAPDQLFAGSFAYNVETWEPTVSYQNNRLTIRQGSGEDAWGWPDGRPRNEWALEFSPEVPLAMDIKAGAGEGQVDLTGLQIEQLDLDLGAGDFAVRFDEPNEADLQAFTIDTGASRLQVVGVGNASPGEMTVQGGVGDISVDLTGDWVRASDVTIIAGVGELTVRVPADVGARVQVEGGLSNVEATGLDQSAGAYVNDAYGETEFALEITITAGIGQVNLDLAAEDD